MKALFVLPPKAWRARTERLRPTRNPGLLIKGQIKFKSLPRSPATTYLTVYCGDVFETHSSTTWSPVPSVAQLPRVSKGFCQELVTIRREEVAGCLLNANSCHQTEFSRIINCRDASQLTPRVKKSLEYHQQSTRICIKGRKGLCGQPTEKQLRGRGPSGLSPRPVEGTDGIRATTLPHLGRAQRWRGVGRYPRCYLSFVPDSRHDRGPVDLPPASEPQFPHL